MDDESFSQEQQKLKKNIKRFDTHIKKLDQVVSDLKQITDSSGSRKLQKLVDIPKIL